jgi:diacylglycerol kinase (ATP)
MPPDRRLICNPTSGDGSHAERVHHLATERALPVVETKRPGDAAALARNAVADGIAELAVCGGDGTLQEVLIGLNEAGVFADAGATDVPAGDDRPVRTPPTLTVLPAGTANIFATDMGITDLETGFSVFDAGPVRRLDVGMAGGEPFMKSCIAGLTADTSSATSDELKERVGSVAFVVSGLSRAADFDPLSLTVTGGTPEGEWAWRGEALCLVVGNARRYAGEIGQANVEDGLLDVTLVEEMPPSRVIPEAVARQLFGRETENVTRIKTRSLTVEALDGPVEFSLDGEMRSHDRLAITLYERALPVRVGPTYEPDPDVSTLTDR